MRYRGVVFAQAFCIVASLVAQGGELQSSCAEYVKQCEALKGHHSSDGLVGAAYLFPCEEKSSNKEMNLAIAREVEKLVASGKLDRLGTEYIYKQTLCTAMLSTMDQLLTVDRMAKGEAFQRF